MHSVIPPNFKERTERADDLVQWVRGYSRDRVNSRLIDERRTVPPHVILDFGNQGILGMQVPERYGGIGLSTVELMHVIQQLTSIDLTLGTFVGLNNWLGVWPVQEYASEGVKAELLPALASGRQLAAFAFTEPCAGSDARSIRTRADDCGNGLQKINGEKAWIGSGAWAGVTTVFVQQHDTEGRPCGISGYVVKSDSPGIYQGDEALTMGMRGMIQNSVKFNDVFVENDYSLGKPGFAMDIAQDVMMHARLGIAGLSLGAMKKCAHLMVRYAERRRISTGVLIDNPVTQYRLSDALCAITAIDTLVFTMGYLIDQGIDIPFEVYTACKSSGPEFLGQSIDHLTQLLGARGYIETNYAPQILRDARILRIFEGPTETMNMYLGGRILKGSAEFSQFMKEILFAGDIDTLLAERVAEIRHAMPDQKWLLQSQLAVKRWMQYKVGQLTTFAILMAFLKQPQSKNYGPQNAALERAFQWAQAHFNNVYVEACKGVPATIAMCDLTQLDLERHAILDEVGEVEQSIGDEDRAVDAFLKTQFIVPFGVESAETSVEEQNQKDDLSNNAVLEGLNAVSDQAVEKVEEVEPRTDFESSHELVHWLINWVANAVNLQTSALTQLMR